MRPAITGTKLMPRHDANTRKKTAPTKGPSQPTRPMVTLKTSWSNVRDAANVKGRWHDNRHTLITDLAERGAGEETIRDIAGHVSKQMLKHYTHIRMQAKRDALESIVPKPPANSSHQTSGGEGTYAKISEHVRVM